MTTATAKKVLVASDTETFLIGPQQVAPKLVCCSSAVEDGGTIKTDLMGNGDQGLENRISGLLDLGHDVLYHNAAFDLAVKAAAYPHLMPKIWAKLAAQEVHDTVVREKLLNLATHGKLAAIEMGRARGDGTLEVLVTKQIHYSLGALVGKYLGEDRSDVKTAGDAWRLNYRMLDGKKAVDYPDEAVLYAKQDASDTLRVYQAQERRCFEAFGLTASAEGSTSAGELILDPFATEPFHVAVAFALHLMTCWGWKVDLEAKAKIQTMLEQELTDEKLELLIESEILRPAAPPRPWVNGAKNPDGSPRMTRPVNPSIDRRKLIAHIEDICAQNQLDVKRTEPTELYENGQVRSDEEFLMDLSVFSPILQQYRHRQGLMKLVTTELPRLSGEVVHPNFDVIKETGRTSSFAGKLYPSCNIQNVDPRARGCYVPREGNLLCSADFHALELVSLAQKCYSLFGYSTLRDLINGGVDPHAYLGSQLAWNLSGDFKEWCAVEAPMEVFKKFATLKKGGPEEKEFFKHWRTFAKPTGLGFPGGLGAQTFIAFAKGAYGVVVDLETAKRLRDIWFDTYPEMRPYFAWVTSDCKDPRNAEKYAYVSPLGMYRAGASYCACANGAALQTPSAEGAKLAVFRVVRACYDPTLGSCLYGCKPLAFIHDEIIVELPQDEFVHERANEVGRLMVEAMGEIMPDMTIKANPCLMERWNKDAEPVFDDKGRLTIWRPKK